MSLQLLPVLRQRYFDTNGAPLAGGKLYSYIAGTSTPSATYQDESGFTPNSNPIILDADGYANVWISVGGGFYKFVLNDVNDVTQWTVDNVSVSSSTAPSGWTKHLIADGQSVADLTGEILDLSTYSSAFFDVEVIRGTTVCSNYPGGIVIQGVNGVGRLLVGMDLQLEANGVTFSISQVGTIVTLRAATDSGAGAGTIKISKRLVPI